MDRLSRCLLVALIAVGIAGCGSINQQPDQTHAAQTTAKTSAAHIGDAVRIAGGLDEVISVQLVKFVDPATQVADGLPLDAGKHLIAVQFRITNVGAVAYSDTATSASRVIDSVGQSYDASYLDTTVGPAFGGTPEFHIAPGDSELGVVSFEVPDGTKIAKLQYAPDSGLGDAGQWVIS